MYITRYSCQILMKIEFSRKIFEKYPKHQISRKLMQWMPSWSSFPVSRRVRSVNVTIHLQVLSNLRMNGALPPRLYMVSRCGALTLILLTWRI